MKQVISRFRRRKFAMAGLIWLLLLLVVAVFAPLLAPYSPEATNLSGILARPGAEGHLLGTDDLGRDVLSRLIFGARVAIIAVLQATAIAGIVGSLIGLAAGYLGGWVDGVVSRITDALLAFPPLLLAIAVVGTLGVGLQNAMIAVGIAMLTIFIRVARAAALEIREETYIEASRSIGRGNFAILVTRVAPNAFPPILVQLSFAAATALLAESTLSFLGLGVQLPEASWGLMAGRAYPYMVTQPWLLLAPSIVLSLTIMSFSIVGNGLRVSLPGKSSISESS